MAKKQKIDAGTEQAIQSIIAKCPYLERSDFDDFNMGQRPKIQKTAKRRSGQMPMLTGMMVGVGMPKMKPEEVEIATWGVNSTMGDVVSLRTKALKRRYRHRSCNDGNGEVCPLWPEFTTEPYTLAQVVSALLDVEDGLYLMTLGEHENYDVAVAFSSYWSSFYDDFGSFMEFLTDAYWAHRVANEYDDREHPLTIQERREIGMKMLHDPESLPPVEEWRVERLRRVLGAGS